jgi:environmental stress-induced protein Ves
LSALEILRAADRPAIAWKNGGGITHDVAVSPPGLAWDGFDWRISIAKIAAGGPFSRFPGIDRRLVVLDGKVALTVEGREAVMLDPDSDPLDFPGEAAVDAALVGGPSMDMNVMTRRGRFVSRISRRSAMKLTISASVTIIVAMGDLTVANRSGPQRMGALDALVIEGTMSGGVTIAPENADFYLIEIIELRQR